MDIIKQIKNLVRRVLKLEKSAPVLLTQAEYDALEKNSLTTYYIIEE